MSDEATGVKWERYGDDGDIIYQGDGFYVRVLDDFRWLAREGKKLVEDNYCPNHATAKAQAERWILEREGRLPATATDGGWIACSERMPECDDDVEVIAKGWFSNGEWHCYATKTSYWRPLPVDPHAVAACLFNDASPTLEQARAAARHVAGCAECRAKLQPKGGA